MVDILNIHMPKSEVGPLPHTMYKNYSESINDLNIRAKVIKFLEENIGINLHEL